MPTMAEGEAAADADARRAIEAVLMVAEMPVEPQLLAQLLELPVARVAALCEAMAADYEAEGRGFTVVSVAGGWRFQSHADLAPYVERFVLEGQSARLSAAALETLAIVAYKQPVSRAQVAAIRGVNVDGVIRTLHQRGFISEVGKDPGPGQAILFGTTPMFLERLGLNGLDQLPPLSEFVPGADVVEHLESGLRPTPGPTLTERLDELEAATAAGGEAGDPMEIRLDEIDLDDLDDEE
jgi:segregation and condensation protein B